MGLRSWWEYMTVQTSGVERNLALLERGVCVECDEPLGLEELIEITTLTKDGRGKVG